MGCPRREANGVGRRLNVDLAGWFHFIELHRLDVLGTRAFFAHAFCERHILAFVQGFKTDALDDRRVKEQVFAIRQCDETESLVSQLLDGAFWHLCVP